MGMIITATPVFRCRRIEAGLLSAGQDFTNKNKPIFCRTWKICRHR